MANIKQQKKRILTNEKRHAFVSSFKASVKTAVNKAINFHIFFIFNAPIKVLLSIPFFMKKVNRNLNKKSVLLFFNYLHFSLLDKKSIFIIKNLTGKPRSDLKGSYFYANLYL